MNIRLKGHNYKYAAEQIMLSLFPEERAVFVDSDMQDSFALSVLEVIDGYGVSKTEITYTSKNAISCQTTPFPLPKDKLTRDRELQKIVKLSFFMAAVQITGKLPPWGAITGIRPVKLATRYLIENSKTPDDAVKFLTDEYYVSPERSELCKDAVKASLWAKSQLSPSDISLYIGIPFCPSKCAYCSFVSHSVEKSFNLVNPYMQALKREVEETGKIISMLGMKVRSVYIGGGTPTTLSAEQLSELMQTVKENFNLSSCLEYTIEAGRPDTITADKLKAIKKAGATRISINPQSMNDSVLEAIGRSHKGSDIIDSFKLARKLGFSMINMDLIAGLPSDTVDGFKRSLDCILELSPENITIHTLSIKRGSKLIETGYGMSCGQAVGDMLDYAFKSLRKINFKPFYLYRQKFTAGGYENTGWSALGKESLYNICIMEELHSIVSLGAGGVTKLVDPHTGRIERIFNKKYPLEYINSIDHVIDSKNFITEFKHSNNK